MACNCPTAAEIAEFENMSVEERKKFMRDSLQSSVAPFGFKLCQQVAVQTPAQADAEFLAKVAEGDLISWNAQRAAGDTPAPIQYTFQPELQPARYYKSSDPW